MKKSLFICLALVLTLAVTGFTFALWGQDLFINGTVGTGNYAVWSDWFKTNDPANTVDPGKAMDVAVTELAMQNDANGLPTIGIVKVKNAYPGYSSTQQFCVHNKGTIPAKITGCVVTNANAPEILSVTSNATDMIGAVIMPGQYKFFDFTNTVGDNAAMNGSYTYSVVINTVQAQ